MNKDIHLKRIDRPSRRPGYRPKYWCAVCGKKVLPKTETAIPCITKNCPNWCHVDCFYLTDELIFNCEDTIILRKQAGIPNPIEFFDPKKDLRGEKTNPASPSTSTSSDTQTDPASPSTSTSSDTQTDPAPPSTSSNTHLHCNRPTNEVNERESEVDAANQEDDSELLELEPQRLVSIIKQLRAELRRKKNILSFFDTTSKRIAEQRDAVVTILEFVDNIASTKSSFEELDVRTIATSASPEWIDKQWQDRVSTNQASSEWWSSKKPRKLRSAARQHKRGVNASTETCDIPTPATSSECQTTGTTRDTTNQRSDNTGPPIPQNTQDTPTETCDLLLPATSSECQTTRATGYTTNHRSNHTGRPIHHNTHNRSNNITSQRQVRPAPHSQAHSTTRSRQAPATSPRTTRPPGRGFCRHCRRSGHTEDTCFRRKKCDFCQRQGHTINECHTRLEQMRQENFLKQLSAEQAKNNALLLQTLSKNLVPPAPTPGSTHFGVWTPRQAFPPPQFISQPHHTTWSYATPQTNSS